MILLSKTIKQIADELGVSKTAIRKHMTPEFRASYVQTDENGLLYINEDGEKHLKSLRKSPQTKFAETTGNLVPTDFVAILQEQLKVKDEQIKSLSAQIEQLHSELATERLKNNEQIAQLTTALENMTESLTAAQALHAADKQQLLMQQSSNDEVPRHWWQRKKKGEQ